MNVPFVLIKLLAPKPCTLLFLLLMIPLDAAAQVNHQDSHIVPVVPDHIRHTFFTEELSEERMRIDLLKIELAKLIAQGLGIELVNDICSFKRCMADLFSGQSDLILFPSVSTFRSEYLDFLNVIKFDQSPLLFFIRKGEEQRLTKFSDLYNLNIGMISGYFYAEVFNDDKNIVKHEVAKPEYLPELLLSNRIDAFIAYWWPTAKQYPDIVIAPFRINIGDIAVVGLSKASPNYAYLKEHLPGVLNDILMEGHLERLCRELDAPCTPEALAYRPD